VTPRGRSKNSLRKKITDKGTPVNHYTRFCGVLIPGLLEESAKGGSGEKQMVLMQSVGKDQTPPSMTSSNPIWERIFFAVSLLKSARERPGCRLLNAR
jgi:hypothetical protein